MSTNALEPILLWAGVVVLGLVMAWGSYQYFRFRREQGLPLGARAASPEEAAYNAAVGQGREKSTGTYLWRLGLPIVAALALIVVLAVIYTR